MFIKKILRIHHIYITGLGTGGGGGGDPHPPHNKHIGWRIHRGMVGMGIETPLKIQNNKMYRQKVKKREQVMYLFAFYADTCL